MILTKCTKIIKSIEKEKGGVFNLSTQKITKTVEKWLIFQSYPHYPHRNKCFLGITFAKKEQAFLLYVMKMCSRIKRNEKDIDILVIKILKKETENI